MREPWLFTRQLLHFYSQQPGICEMIVNGIGKLGVDASCTGTNQLANHAPP